jgi:hypothetical protein
MEKTNLNERKPPLDTKIDALNKKQISYEAAMVIHDEVDKFSFGSIAEKLERGLRVKSTPKLNEKPMPRIEKGISSFTGSDPPPITENKEEDESDDQRRVVCSICFRNPGPFLELNEHCGKKHNVCSSCKPVAA